MDGIVAGQLERSDDHPQSELYACIARLAAVAHQPSHPQLDAAAVCLKCFAQRRINTINMHKSYGNWLKTFKALEATIDKLEIITVHNFVLFVIYTQMSVMPEASSALFMSQFSDEAVRDAIARVSFSIRATLQQSTPSGNSSDVNANVLYLDV